jgi:hypothetical protein
VPGPAAQSFSPASETPKHFSFSIACAVVARPVTEVATADAMIMVFEVTDMLCTFQGYVVFRCRRVLAMSES